jgi:hypothetical protein
MLGLVEAGCLQRRSSLSSRSSVFASTSRTRTSELAIQAVVPVTRCVPFRVRGTRPPSNTAKQTRSLLEVPVFR